MSNPLALQIALANLGYLNDKPDIEEIYNFIESEIVNIETYQLDSKKVSAAAIDYVILLGVVGSVASIASILWMTYEKFIAPKKANDKDNSGIYITMRKPDGSLIEFWIGNEYKNRDIFIKDFTHEVSNFKESGDSIQHFHETSIEVKNSGHWIQRK